VKTTKDDFEYFQRECLKWIDRFHLNDWDIVFSWEDLEDQLGELHAKYAARKAVIVLSKDFGDIFSNRKKLQLRQTAFHEVCELLLIRIGMMAKARVFDEEELEAEIHAVINRLMKVLL
jgi:hypothetical protein